MNRSPECIADRIQHTLPAVSYFFIVMFHRDRQAASRARGMPRLASAPGHIAPTLTRATRRSYSAPPAARPPRPSPRRLPSRQRRRARAIRRRGRCSRTAPPGEIEGRSRGDRGEIEGRSRGEGQVGAAEQAHVGVRHGECAAPHRLFLVRRRPVQQSRTLAISAPSEIQ